MKNVLVVDDTKNIRVLLTTCLELRGYTVLTSASGQSALDIIEKEKDNIELIFLDIRMPEMNGTEVLKNIRKLEVTCPVIIMTAFATIKNAVDCTKLGATAYLQKPFSPERVNAVIDELFTSNKKLKDDTPSEDDASFFIAKAREQLETENYSEAFTSLKTALSINPYNKDIYHLLSIVNEKTNNEKEASRFNKIYELFKD